MQKRYKKKSNNTIHYCISSKDYNEDVQKIISVA